MPKRGEDARGYSARALGALGEANQRILDGADQYNDVRERVNQR